MSDSRPRPAVETMRAAVVAAPGETAVVPTPLPDTAPGEALVRIEGCGVCGSNLPVWEGRPWLSYPLAAGEPGHEAWGYVERVSRSGGGGASAGDGVAPGTRVALLSYRGFAEYDVCPTSHLVPLPPELDGVPFPAEAIGCGMNVFRRARIEAGATVAVVGVGFLGALLVRLAAEAGARVLAFSRREFALEVARTQGAHDALPLEAVADDDGSCDVVIEAAGAQETLDLATRLVRERGRLVVAGYHQDGARTVDMQTWNWRAIDVVNAHEREADVYVEGMRLGADTAAAGVIDVAPLVTHSFPLQRLGEAFDTARDRPDGFLKAVVLA